MYHQRDKKLRLLVASAWTGGHIFPGISICKEMKKFVKDMEIFFVVNKKGPAVTVLKKYGCRVIFLDAEGIKGMGLAAVKNILRLFHVLIKSFNIVRKISPTIILGLGGSSSGPICIVGKLLNIPVVIHEQNILPGFTNRILSHFVDGIFVSFQETKNILRKKNVIVSGNPVREEFFQIKKQKKDIFTILVIGGSQGSVVINQAFLDALYILNKEGRKVDVIHQTGEIGYEAIRDRYRELGLKARIMAFIEDISSFFRETDLVICRAGASTLFELSASGTPSILIPYPYATDQHQKKNALFLAKLGGAEVICQEELTGQRLADIIKKYMDHPEELKKMEKNVKLLSHPESARVIATYMLQMIGK